MSAVPASPMKVCVVCRTDVAKLPRVKDPQGQYYCKSCYDGARKEAATKHTASPTPARPKPTAVVQPPRSAKAPSVKVVPAAHPPRAKIDGVPVTKLAEDDLVSLDDFDAFESSSPGPTCPSCGSPMPSDAILCTGCGYNRTTGGRISTNVGVPKAIPVAKSKRAGGGAVVGARLLRVFASPGVLALSLIAFWVVFFLIAKTSIALVMLFGLAQSVFCLAASIWVVVVAFQGDGAGSGVLALICSPYNIYYCYAKQSNDKLKAVYTAGLVSFALAFALGASPILNGLTGPGGPTGGFGPTNPNGAQTTGNNGSDDEEDPEADEESDNTDPTPEPPKSPVKSPVKVPAKSSPNPKSSVKPSSNAKHGS